MLNERTASRNLFNTDLIVKLCSNGSNQGRDSYGKIIQEAAHQVSAGTAASMDTILNSGRRLSGWCSKPLMK